MTLSGAGHAGDAVCEWDLLVGDIYEKIG